MKCLVCGKEFVATGRRQIYCGSRKFKTGCSFDVYVKKHNEWKRLNKNKQRKYKLKNSIVNSERNKLLANERVNKLKQIVTNYKIMNGCKKCGLKDPRVLDCHHIKDKKWLISYMATRNTINKIKEELSKCIVLCANCHRIEHSK